MTKARTNLQRTLLQRLSRLKAKKNNNIFQKGFTLIELLIVVIILGVLAAVVYPSLLDAADQAKVNAADAAVKGAGTTCAATLVTGDSFTVPDGIASGTCSSTATFVSTLTDFDVDTAATAVVSGTSVTVTTSAVVD